jgi:hypothetical protein
MSFTAYATDYLSNQAIASGETTCPRLNVGTAAALVSGQMQLSYWTAQKSEAVNVHEMNSGSIAAGATPTYAAMGLYTVDSLGNLTLVSQCASDTTLFAATFTLYTRAAIASYIKQAGQRYASGVLVVSAAAMPALTGYNGTVSIANIAPRLSGIVVGQAALPASVPVGSIANSSQFQMQGVTP